MSKNVKLMFADVASSASRIECVVNENFLNKFKINNSLDNIINSGDQVNIKFINMQRMSRREEELAVNELIGVLHSTRLVNNPLPGYDKNIYQERYQIGLDCDEVYPNIYIGDASSAKNKQYLMKLGISHVVNTAEGKLLGMVDTDQDFYRNTTIKYLGFSIMDLPISNISQYFDEVADFMEKAIKGGGKVLVHCLMGMSRSSTCVLAYLMIKEGMTAAQAIRQVRQHRDIHPNDGFVLQLVQLENKLKRERFQ